MAHNETGIVKAAMIRVSRLGVRVFRNNVGVLNTSDGRMVRVGLCNGSSDLIGWTSVVVTPDMVGKRVAIFTALEGKTPTGRVTPEQQNFIEQVRLSGGRAGVFRSEEEAEVIVRG